MQPFEEIKNLDEELIEKLVENSSVREKCQKCQKSQATYCSFCCIAIQHRAPFVDLPINVDIYRHWNEKPQASTTVHCKIVAPLKTTIYEYREGDSMEDLITRYPDPSRVLLLYPTADSSNLCDLNPSSYDTLTVIDGTWNQAKPMSKKFASLGFRHVKISSHETKFWRYQNLNLTYLATIEAIYWFFVDYHSAYSSGEYDGRFDNLLLYFKTNWQIIQRYYKERPGKPFTTRHALSDSFIVYEE